MTREDFEALIAREWPRAIPERFRALVRNVALLVDDAPSLEVREQEGLGEHETLLGYYRGIPRIARGEGYGTAGTMPDTITLYQGPIEDEARESDGDIARVVRETLWHEVAHHFGFDEHEVRQREDMRGKQ